MLTLYYRPLACSLASRIAIEEAGIEARFERVDLKTKRLGQGGDFLAVSAKGQVPVVRTAEGVLLSEGAAVLQYLADQRPASALAPPPDDPFRYQLQSWLNFIATELHKQGLFPRFMDGTPGAVREYGLERFAEKLDHVEAHLAEHAYLMGDSFTVADAYLVWLLVLARFARCELPPHTAAYLERLEQRPSVARALARELAELQAEPGS